MQRVTNKSETGERYNRKPKKTKKKKTGCQTKDNFAMIALRMEPSCLAQSQFLGTRILRVEDGEETWV